MRLFWRPPILGTALLIVLCAIPAFSQQVCPANTVCVDQGQFNIVISKLNELVAAREAIAKLTAERMQSDAVIVAAQKVIADYKEMDNIHQMQITKYANIVALYEKVIAMYQGIVEKLETKLNASKSAWQKLVTILKTVTVLITGVTIGRGI